MASASAGSRAPSARATRGWRARHRDLGADQGHLGELTGAEAGGVRLADRLGGDLLELRRSADVRGDEGAAALAADHEPGRFEPGVDAADRIEVDPRPLGEVGGRWAGARRRGVDRSRSGPAGGGSAAGRPAARRPGRRRRDWGVVTDCAIDSSTVASVWITGSVPRTCRAARPIRSWGVCLRGGRGAWLGR